MRLADGTQVTSKNMFREKFLVHRWQSTHCYWLTHTEVADIVARGWGRFRRLRTQQRIEDTVHLWHHCQFKPRGRTHWIDARPFEHVMISPFVEEDIEKAAA